jgi:hypothetical protein
MELESALGAPVGVCLVDLFHVGFLCAGYGNLPGVYHSRNHSGVAGLSINDLAKQLRIFENLS